MRLATALALCGLAAAEDAGVMKLLRFSDHGIGDALCMDGSSSGIYFAPATAQTDKYVLYLQGGGWCSDEASCQQRCGARIKGRCSGALASSAAWPAVQSMSGLFSTSPAKTPLPGANKAYLRYCTGDAHMGNRNASAASFGFNFHGQRTVRAALSILVKAHGLGSKPGHTLLFGGGSAGGRGAMVNLDFVPGLLADMGAASAPRVLGFPDSPYWIDLVPDRAALPPDRFIGFAKQTQEIFALANISGRASAECAASFPTDPWKCALGVYRMPFVKTKYMMVASQSDAFQLFEDLGHMPVTLQELACAQCLLHFAHLPQPGYSHLSRALRYAQVFADYTHGNASMLIAPGTPAAKAGSTVFSMNCFSHSTSLTDHGMSGMNVGGYRMMDALADFIGQGQGGAPLPAGGFFDPAKGFNSGKGCLAP